MAETYKDIEIMGDVIVTALSAAAFATKLAIITAEKADDVLLEVPKRVLFGVTGIEGELPVIFVCPASEDPVGGEGSFRITWYSFVVELYTVFDDSAKVERQVARYCRAIRETILGLSTYKGQFFHGGTTYPPTFQVGDYLLKGAVVRLRFRTDIDE